jgi:uncharacterized protein YukE
VSKAVVDPEELRRFAFDLKRFNTEMQSQIASVNRRFVKLGETWQDQEHQKFAEDFEKIIAAMAKFVDAADKHIPFLLRKAQKIQEYLD